MKVEYLDERVLLRIPGLRVVGGPQVPKSGRTRHKRYNARGDVWCNRCERYLPAHAFKRVAYPSLPRPKYWAYCKPCTREIDRERYAKRTSTLEGAIAMLNARLERKRRWRAKVRQDRLDFVQGAIRQLNGRGLTMSEIARIGGFALESLYRWMRLTEPPKHGITENVERRFEAMVAAAIEVLPPPGKSEVLNYRRRLPHPDLPRLIALCQDAVERYPVRNSWKNGARDHERRQA